MLLYTKRRRYPACGGKPQRALSRSAAEQVRRARAQGYSWQAIAGALEISKQAVHKKYGRR
ncbi:hypothetical protein [Rarobacter faecitabidus]|nr:hypothetical protein [Rarobacter faecitabidus]